jgi:peptide-methionine (R)-S-oxide reductase
MKMKRRAFLSSLSAVSIAGLACRGHANSSPKDGKGQAAAEELQKNWRSFLADGADVAKLGEPLKLSNEEWKKQLSKEAYHVLREEGTEYPGSSPLLAEHRPGVFVCAGCKLPLFTSAMKFDSGTGWPSFFTTIPGVFGTSSDTKLVLPRTEYHCGRCGGHHGHVFDDGPPPTGLRYCNNGVALRFIPKK